MLIETPHDESGEAGLTETFAVRGELDLASSSILEHALIDELAAIPDGLALDRGGLAFIDVAGFRALHRIRAHLAARGCRLSVRSVPPQAARLLELTPERLPSNQQTHGSLRLPPTDPELRSGSPPAKESVPRHSDQGR